MSTELPVIWPLGAKCDRCDRRVGGSVALVTGKMGVYCAGDVLCRAAALARDPSEVWEWLGWPSKDAPPVNIAAVEVH